MVENTKFSFKNFNFIDEIATIDQNNSVFTKFNLYNIFMTPKNLQTHQN